MKNLFQTWKQDVPAGLVVFLVAVPLCLGIALASDAPVFSGLIAGIVGGLVVGSFSGSSIGVSGPAAGLTAIVASAIHDLGSFELFLCAVVIAGILQFILGIVKAGIISQFFPHIVIKGMLTAIGLIIILKQIPHAIGYDKDPEGDQAFVQADGHNTFSEFLYLGEYITPTVIFISIISILVLVIWERKFIQKTFLRFVPAPLVVVLVGILATLSLEGTNWALSPEHRVDLGLSGSDSGSFITLPDFNGLLNPSVYLIGITIAIVASIESLLCVEAGDKIDPKKRKTSTNRELIAQGIGNFTSGILGGLPVTQVIVRSSTNVNSGGVSKLSTIMHGIFIALAVITIPSAFGFVPFASLAIVLIQVGYKLAKPSLFKHVYKEGITQFIPFIVTIISILLTDLLIGIIIGMICTVLIILYQNFLTSYYINSEGDVYYITLTEHMTFLNKASLVKAFSGIPENKKVIIDSSQSKFISQDIIESIEDFKEIAHEKKIELEIINPQNKK